MAVEITGSYTGKLKMELTHGPSGTVIQAAAPKDNQGDGSSFSPTDLAAAALGSCIVMTMAIAAEREGIPFDGVSFSLEKHMRSDPRRIDFVPVRIRMPGGLTEEQRAKLEAAGRGCPVCSSLSPEVRREVKFEYA